MISSEIPTTIAYSTPYQQKQKHSQNPFRQRSSSVPNHFPTDLFTSQKQSPVVPVAVETTTTPATAVQTGRPRIGINNKFLQLAVDGLKKQAPQKTKKKVFNSKSLVESNGVVVAEDGSSLNVDEIKKKKRAESNKKRLEKKKIMKASAEAAASGVEKVEMVVDENVESQQQPADTSENGIEKVVKDLNPNHHRRQSSLQKYKKQRSKSSQKPIITEIEQTHEQTTTDIKNIIIQQSETKTFTSTIVTNSLINGVKVEFTIKIEGDPTVYRHIQSIPFVFSVGEVVGEKNEIVDQDTTIVQNDVVEPIVIRRTNFDSQDARFEDSLKDKNEKETITNKVEGATKEVLANSNYRGRKFDGEFVNRKFQSKYNGKKRRQESGPVKIEIVQNPEI